MEYRQHFLRMLQETDSVQLFLCHELSISPGGCRVNRMWLKPRSQQVAHHLGTFGHKEVLALAVLFQFQRPHQFYLVLAQHLFPFFAAKLRIIL